MKQLSILLLIIIVSGCKKELIEATNLKVVWETEFTNVLAASIEPVIYDDIVIFSKEVTNVDLRTPLSAYNKNTGEKLWEWDNYEENIFIFSMWAYRYTYENYLIFAGHHSVYCIDMNTGKTIWNDTDFSTGTQGQIRGIGNKIYFVRGTSDNNQRWIVSKNIITEESYKIIEYETINEHQPWTIHIPDFYINEIGDAFLVVTYGYFKITELSSKFHWGVYSITQDKFIHTEHITDSTGSGNIGEPIVKDGKAYIGIGNSLFCYDIESGSQLWKVWIEGKIGFTGYIVEDGKVYCGSEGLDPKLYSIDSETGQVLWTTSTAGTSGLMSYRNGTIYFTGGGFLHVIDGANGQYIGKYEAPYNHENSNLFFSRATSLDPVTGRIFTTDYKNLYCIEPVR